MSSAEQPVVFWGITAQVTCPLQWAWYTQGRPCGVGRPSFIKAGGEQLQRCCPLLATQAQPAQLSPHCAPQAVLQGLGPRAGLQVRSPATHATEREAEGRPHAREGACSRSRSKFISPIKEYVVMKSRERTGQKAGQAVWERLEKGFLFPAGGWTHSCF